jgi:hypothetical protein
MVAFGHVVFACIALSQYVLGANFAASKSVQKSIGIVQNHAKESAEHAKKSSIIGSFQLDFNTHTKASIFNDLPVF